MSLERRDLTQLVTFDPPPPRVAFAILGQGTTTSQETWGGSGTVGLTYSWFLLDTTWWVQYANTGNIAADQNPLPIPIGSKFQVYNGDGGAFLPSFFLVNPAGATDLLQVNDLLEFCSPLDTTLRTVVGIRQAASDGSQWYIYFGPSTDTQFPASTSGIVTWPEPKNAQWMGQIGHVTGIQMDWSKPGGPTSLQFNLTCPPDFRVTGMDCGRRIQAYRGSDCIWDGTLQEPQTAATGWAITANGVGLEGSNFAAAYDFWNADDPINDAIGRGLRWRNDGIGSPPGLFGLTSSNAQDSGSLTIQDFLNLLCTSGSLYWSVEPPMTAGIPCDPWVLRIKDFPTDIDGNPLSAGIKAAEQWNVQEWQRMDLKAKLRRLPPDLYIINSTPVSRTLNGTYNTLVCRYKATPDIPATSATAALAATYSTVIIDQPGAVAAQGRSEYYLDMTSNDVMTEAQVIQVAQNILNQYVRLSFFNAYTVQPGRLLNNGGEPVDLAFDYSGKMATVLVENAPFGGTTTLDPLTFFIADYMYDDDSQTGTITPYQSAGKDIQSLIAEIYPNGFN
jgi:hypothetical protein